MCSCLSFFVILVVLMIDLHSCLLYGSGQLVTARVVLGGCCEDETCTINSVRSYCMTNMPVSFEEISDFKFALVSYRITTCMTHELCSP